jgi:hypothetical protein
VGVDKNSLTDRIGVSMLELFFNKQGWLFREQVIHDHGIDAHVEVVINGEATGRLIAIQIKTGKSYFSEKSGGNYIFRTDQRHAEYWAEHCLPVILVMINPEEGELVWQALNDSTIVRTGKGYKVSVPASKKLDANALAEIAGLSNYPDYIQKINKLRLDQEWMKLIHDGWEVYIEFNDWVNKSLARFEIKIGSDHKDFGEKKWPMIYGAGMSIEDALSYVIPWASFAVDEDLHREEAEGIWCAECYGGYDKEDDIVYYTMGFDEWYTPPEGLVPCSEDGETAHYRLILSLNDIGSSFLELDEFLRSEEMLKSGAR